MLDRGEFSEGRGSKPAQGLPRREWRPRPLRAFAPGAALADDERQARIDQAGAAQVRCGLEGRVVCARTWRESFADSRIVDAASAKAGVWLHVAVREPRAGAASPSPPFVAHEGVTVGVR